MPPTNVPLLENTKAKMCGYGRYPSVTSNNSNIVVAVCNSEVSDVDGGLTIDWGKDEGYGAGFFPRVSIQQWYRYRSTPVPHERSTISHRKG